MFQFLAIDHLLFQNIVFWKSILNDDTPKLRFNSPDPKLENLAKGCIIGAFLGDAIGAYLDPPELDIDDGLIEKAFSLCEGGIFDLSRGQITEDSELIMSLMQGLIDGQGQFSIEMIIKHYKEWINSSPFDIGESLRHAFLPLVTINDEDYADMVRLVTSASQKYNKKSQGNGTLMRIAPLAIWCYNINNLEDFESIIRLEVCLTHPNLIIEDASISYCLAIRHLLNNEGDIKGAYNKVDWWISNHALKELKEWWIIVKNGEWIDANENKGWAKISWTYAFLALKECIDKGRIDYAFMIKKILKKGGDTDTNACIAGALLGVASGYDNLLKKHKETIEILLSCDLTKSKQERPSRYNPGNIMKMIKDLLAIAPLKFELV